jgi:hypothetical protein
MPVWTAKGAEFLQAFIQLGEAGWRALSAIGGALSLIWGKMTPAERTAVASGGILALFFGAGRIPIVGPVILASMVLGGLLVLLDDFFKYIDGSKSSKTLAPIWYTLLGVLDKISKFTLTAVASFERMGELGWKKLLTGDPDKAARERFQKRIEDIWKTPSLTEGHSPDRDTNMALAGKSQRLRPGGGAGIARQESAGNYNAVNPQSGAAGKYQIMPENWGPWSKAAGLGGNAPMTPENQEVVFAHRYGLYMQKYGDERLAAAAWYGGEGTANRLRRGDMTALDIKPRNGWAGPSVGDYIYQTTGKRWDGDITINVGGPTVNVTQSNTPPQNIAKVVEEAYEKATSRMMREFSSVMQ